MEDPFASRLTAASYRRQEDGAPLPPPFCHPYNALSERLLMRLLPLAGTVALALVSVAAAPPAKKPASPPPKPAAAAGKPAPVKGDPYSIVVAVDASAASASAAQTKAINGGRARAWGEISHRMVPQKDWGKLPSLDDAALERLIRGYTVADEKRSTTRYNARVTYIFNP